MSKKIGFLKFYLFVVLFLGLFGLFDNLFTIFKTPNNVYVYLFVIIYSFEFIFSLAIIPVLYYLHAEKRDYFLPSFVVGSKMLITLIGMLLFSLKIFASWLWVVFITIDILIAITKIVVSIYFLEEHKILEYFKEKGWGHTLINTTENKEE